MIVKFKKLDPEAKEFTYSREGDACMDMYSLEEVTLYENKPTLIRTGIAVEIPEGYEGIVRGRSGYALKNDLFVHIGTIDSNYRGDVGVIAICFKGIIKDCIKDNYDNIIAFCKNKYIIIPKHSRIAQFSIHPVTHISLIQDNELSNTNRGDQGYGSSGA